jgi:hypothetical protein
VWQVPIGLEEFHEGVVDVVHRKAYNFSGAKGTEVGRHLRWHHLLMTCPHAGMCWLLRDLLLLWAALLTVDKDVLDAYAVAWQHP